MARDYLRRATEYPHSLGEGKLAGAQENDVYYYLGLAERALGNEPAAADCLRKAAVGLSEPAGMMYYNDQPPETIFYQGLAHYFAVSLPDLQIFEEDLDIRNRVHCLFMRGLGLLGKGETEKARSCFGEARRLDPNHAGIRIHQNFQPAP